MSLSVAMVTATFPPYYAGTGNVALQNAVAVAARGHRVTVITARLPLPPGHDPEGITVRRLRPLIRIGLAPLLPGLFRLPRYDLVHLHYPFIFGAETVLLLQRATRQPYVLTYHNDLLAPGLKGLFFKAYQRVWARRVLGSARLVIAPNREGAGASPYVGALMRRHSERVVEIPNGVDLNLFQPRPAGPARARLGIAQDIPVVAFAGSMDSAHHPKGGVPVLLEALAAARTPGLHALLAGGGDRVAEYRALAQSLGLNGRVRFIGQVPNAQMPEVYAAADLVVQPSQLFEPFGLVAVEAMACERPVIASDLPGVHRVVTESRGGVLVPPGGAGELSAEIDRLFGRSDLRERLGREGRAGVAARYNASTIGAQLEAAYTRALEAA